MRVSHEELSRLLQAEVREATLRHEAAKSEFWRIAADVPSAIPYPDGTVRIQQASKIQAVARLELLNALRRLNAFLSKGEIPEEFQPSKTSQASAG